MISKRQIFYTFLLLLYFPLQAQIEKGEWLISPVSWTHGWGNSQEEEIALQTNFVSFKFLYFPTSRFALGSQFQYTSFYAENDVKVITDKRSWWLMPTLRYYLSDPVSDKAVKIFAEVGADIFMDQNNNEPQLKSLGGIAGLGLNYFFQDKIALELIVAGQYRENRLETATGVFEPEWTFNPNMQLGLRFFLQSPFQKVFGSNVENARWLFGAWMDLNNDDDGALDRHPFFIKGRVAYFLVPGLAAGMEGGIDLGGGKLSSLTIFSDYEIGPFLRYYLPTKQRIQFFPEVGYSLSENIYKGLGSAKARSLKVGMGAHIFLDEHISMEFLLNYKRHQFYTVDNDLSPVQQNSLGLDFNLAYFLY